MAFLSTNGGPGVGIGAGVGVSVAKVPGLAIRSQNAADIPAQRSLGTAKDIDDLLPMIDAALREHQKRLAIEPSKWLAVTAFWPKNPVDCPDKTAARVVMRVANRRQANMANDTTRHQRKPIFKEARKDPNDPNSQVQVQSLWRDNVIEFRVMSSDQSRADDMALFFERFMESWYWYFRDQGIQNIYFDERLEDRIEVIGGAEVYIRPIRYQVRTEIIFQSRASTLRDIRVQFDDGLAAKETVVDEELGISDYSVD